MLDLSKLVASKKTAAPRITVYGEPKIGKTTFASQANSPLIIDLEGGSDNLEIARIGKDQIKSSCDLIEMLRSIYSQEHEFKTVIVDSIDWLERIIFNEVARENDASSIDDFKVQALRFGKGYIIAQNKLKEVLYALDKLREDRKMTIIMICHASIKKVETPEQEGYDCFSLKLNKNIEALIREWSDCILFAKQKIYITSDTGNFGKVTKKGHSGERVICTQNSPSYLAGNRYGLSPELPFDFNVFWDEFVAKTGFNPEAARAEIKPNNVVHLTTTVSSTYSAS